jgi:protein-L-isoaspartate(D-aspartate) O-methyltransferase
MAAFVAVVLLMACRGGQAPAGQPRAGGPRAEGQGVVSPAPERRDGYAAERDRMVREHIEARGVTDARTLAALRKVERHLFVPPELAGQAYADHPLPIGAGQTISQPYIVAVMTEAIRLRGGEKVLEVGTGSGYQAAVLAEAGATVYTIEIVPSLAAESSARLARLGYLSVHVRQGNGWAGWPEQAPFDAIVVTAAPPEVPAALKRQLRDGGRLVIPVGEDAQELLLLTRRGESFEERRLLPVRFVPLVGRPGGETVPEPSHPRGSPSPRGP